MSKNFEELLKTLEGVASDADELSKSIPQGGDADGDGAGSDGSDDDEDDDAIAAAAGGAGGAEADAGAGKKGDGGELGKSFEFVDAAGAKHEAVDATELVKSLMEHQDATDATLAKALETFTGVVQKQGDLIKSLSAQVASLSNQGRGRKAMLAVVEKPEAGTLAKGGEKPGMTTDEFFAKANAAYDAGKLDGKELNVISVCLRSNHPIDQALIQKVALA